MRRLVSLATYFKSDKETRSAGDKEQNHETADANPLLLVSVSPPLLVSSSPCLLFWLSGKVSEESCILNGWNRLVFL